MMDFIISSRKKLMLKRESNDKIINETTSARSIRIFSNETFISKCATEEENGCVVTKQQSVRMKKESLIKYLATKHSSR